MGGRLTLLVACTVCLKHQICTVGAGKSKSRRLQGGQTILLQHPCRSTVKLHGSSELVNLESSQTQTTRADADNQHARPCRRGARTSTRRHRRGTRLPGTCAPPPCSGAPPACAATLCPPRAPPRPPERPQVGSAGAHEEKEPDAVLTRVIFWLFCFVAQNSPPPPPSVFAHMTASLILVFRSLI